MRAAVVVSYTVGRRRLVELLQLCGHACSTVNVATGGRGAAAGRAAKETHVATHVGGALAAVLNDPRRDGTPAAFHRRSFRCRQPFLRRGMSTERSERAGRGTVRIRTSIRVVRCEQRSAAARTETLFGFGASALVCTPDIFSSSAKNRPSPSVLP